MLKINSRKKLNRRSLLQIGTAGIGGLSLTNLLASRAMADQSEFVKDRSIVVLNLQGGPHSLKPLTLKWMPHRKYVRFLVRFRLRCQVCSLDRSSLKSRHMLIE